MQRSRARLRRAIGWFLFLLSFLVCGCQRLNYPNSEYAPDTRFDKTIGIIVNKNLYLSIQNNIYSYTEDVAAIEARKVWIDGESFDSTTSPQALRDTLASLYGRVDLDGVVLIGDLPVAWYELANDRGSSGYVSFPIDLYFMDLNGNWLDTAKDGAWGGNARSGVFDGHSGNIQAEIWVSRIKASTMGNEIEIVKSYFDRVHKRMLGNDSLPIRCLLFQNCYGIYPDFNGDIMYPPGAVDTFDNLINGPHPLDSKENWIAALRKGYEYVQLAEHGSPGCNQFEGINFTIQDYLDMASGPGGISNVRFYNLFSCSNARYTQPNVATYYALGHNGLIAIGSTKPGGMDATDYFHAPLANGESFGEGFKAWFNAYAVFIENDLGMTLIGAATLKLHPYSIKTTHQIVATKTEGGSLNREGRIAIADGDSTTIIITPENNYQIDLVLVDGDTIFTKSFPADLGSDQNNRTIPETKSYTFHAVHEDHCLQARFVQRKEYNLTIIVQGRGFINQCTGIPSVYVDTSRREFERVFYEGDPITYEVASHYAAYHLVNPLLFLLPLQRWSYDVADLAQLIASISDNGKEISSALGKPSYDTSFQIFADHQIIAIFKAVNVFKVNVIVEGNGTFSVYYKGKDVSRIVGYPYAGAIDSTYYTGEFVRHGDTVYVRQNENLRFTTIADSGYTLANISIDSIPLSTNDFLSRVAGPSAEWCCFRLRNIIASHTILLSFGRNFP